MSSPGMADIEAARDSIAALARFLGAQREGATGGAVKVGDTPKNDVELLSFLLLLSLIHI